MSDYLDDDTSTHVVRVDLLVHAGGRMPDGRSVLVVGVHASSHPDMTRYVAEAAVARALRAAADSYDRCQCPTCDDVRAGRVAFPVISESGVG